MIRSTTLDTGVTVVTEHMPDVRSVTTGFFVGVGSRDEAPAELGASHFLEHLLFKGTEQRSAAEIAEAVDSVGGEMNAYTTKEYTTFYTRLLDDDVDLGLGILCDIIGSPALREADVDAERQVILEEILMHGDEPADSVHDLFLEAVYPGHPLGRETLGEAATISAMTAQDIRAFMTRYYSPETVVVAAAGNLDHDHVVTHVTERLGCPGRGGVPERDAPVDRPCPLIVDRRATEQAHLVIGALALPRHDPDRYALNVLNHVIGGGMSSRLFQEIRERRGLAYSVYSYRSSFADTGTFAVYAGTAPGRAHEVRALIDTELDRIVADGINGRELETAKGHLRGSLALGLEDSGARMSRIGRSQLLHGEVPEVDELLAEADAVELADVERVVKRVLGGDRVLAVVGPFEESAFTAPS